MNQGVKVEDVVKLSDRFWDFYLKGVLTMDAYSADYRFPTLNRQ
jgi:hypothetical protein